MLDGDHEFRLTAGVCLDFRRRDRLHLDWLALWALIRVALEHFDGTKWTCNIMMIRLVG